MKVLYDHQTFNCQEYGGISRYFYELFNSFQNNQAIKYELALAYSNNYYLRNDRYFASRIPPKKSWQAKFIKKKNRYSYYESRNRQRTIQLLKKGEYDIFHPTYYAPYFLDYISDKPYVITVYDMIHEIFPEYFASDDPILNNKRESVQGATKIIAISQNTKKDLMRFYHIPESRITVIYLGNSIRPLPNDGRPLNPALALPQRYLLFVGNRPIHKNFYFLITALEKLLREDPKLHLVCVGGGKFNAAEKGYFSNRGIQDRLVHCNASDETLAALYKNALALVLPSIYEGFGIPVLEAFSCGCPVIASNTSALTEVGGTAAVYFEPKDSLSIQEKVTQVLADSSLRTELIAQGYQRAKDFSWAKCARETIELYQSL